MQNKFGLKDFVLMLLVSLIGVFLILSMVQDDRRWTQSQALETKIGSVEQQLARLENKIDEGVAVSSVLGGPSLMNGQGGTAVSQNADGSATDLMGLGVNAESFPRPSFVSDPRGNDDYQRGGVFTEIFEAQPDKVTPILGEDVYGRRVQDLVCETLARFNPESLELEGVLAESWEYDSEGYWVRVKLRDNIRFSDGVEITAEDVRWTFHDYINNPELETESLRSIMIQIDHIDVLSEKVVEIHFVEPDAYNLQAALIFYILPKHFYSTFTPKQINQATGLTMGSGPYKFAELDPDNQWSPGQTVVLVRNEQYWGPKPAIDERRFLSITDDTARLTAFKNGEGSMILPTSPQFVDMVSRPDWAEQAYSLKWLNMRSGYSFVAWQCGPKGGEGELTPFADKRVRQAMTLNLDRELMVRDIWSGLDDVAVGPVNPPSPAANPEIEPWPYDPDRAKVLLAEAGWIDRDGDGFLENERGDIFEFEFIRASGGGTAERMQKYIVDRCAAIGIRCVPKIVDWSLYNQILKTRDFDAIVLGWSASAPESDPTQIWHTNSIQNQGHNFIQWDAGQDVFIDKIKATLDFDERMDVFHDFHSLVHEEQPYTFIRVAKWKRFISKDFLNVHPYPKGLEQGEYYQPMLMTGN
jgi:peptide/nickel transport system substrate-binding protein